MTRKILNLATTILYFLAFANGVNAITVNFTTCNSYADHKCWPIGNKVNPLNSTVPIMISITNGSFHHYNAYLRNVNDLNTNILTLVTNATSASTATYNWYANAAGTYRVCVVVYDASGNELENTKNNVNYNFEVKTITASTGTAHTITSNSAILNGSCASGYGCCGVEYRVMGSSTWTSVPCSSYSGTSGAATVSGLSPGTTYQFQYWGDFCTGIYRGTVSTFTTIPSQPGSISGPTSVCIGGGSQSYSISAVSGATNYTWTLPYGWTGSSTGTSITVTPDTNAQDGQITVKANNSSGSSSVRTLNVSVVAALTQPNLSGEQVVCYNGSTTISLGTAQGGIGTLTYQWQQSTNGSTWTNISGATSQNYTTPALTSNRHYRRQATRSTCGGTITSSSMLVSVIENFTQGHPSGTAICYNSYVTFAIGAATGGSGTLSYQWQQSTNNSTWTNISGATSPSFTTPLLTSNMYYRRQATRSVCGGTITSNAALVTVEANFVQNNPTDATITYNSTHTFNLAAATGGSGTLSYQWQQSANNSTWANISGATSANYTTPALTTNTYYRRNATRASCGGTITGNSALVSVNSPINAQPPNISVQPQPATYTQNATATALSVTASVSDGGALSYQWYRNTTNSNSGGTSVGTGATYTPPTTSAGTLYYYVVVTNTNNGVNGTKTATTASNTATINITPPVVHAQTPNISAQPQPATYTQNATATALSVTASVSDGGTLSYQWYRNTTNSNSGGTSIGTGATYTPPTTSAGTLYYYVVVTNTNNGVNGTKTATTASNTATINITPPVVHAQTPNISVQPQPATYMQNATATALSVTASVSDGGTLSYQWYRNTTNSNSGGTSIGTGATYTPPTSSAGTLYYYVVVTNTNNGVNGTKTATTASNTATINITPPVVNAQTPNITVQPQPATYTQNATATALSVTASVSDGGTLSYQWYRNTTNSNSGGTSVGTGVTYTPPTSSAGTLYYYVVVTNTNNGVNGTKIATTASNTATITVVSNDELMVSPYELNFPSSGGNATVTITSNLVWRVENSTSWLSVTPTNGNNNGSITIEVQPNPSKSRRYTNFTVHGGGIIRQININQDENRIVGPLLSSKWDQRDPYNSLVVSKVGNYPTGCVATALAQIMYYYKHPTTRTQPIPGYTTDTLKIKVDGIPNPTTYKWGNMQKTTIEYRDKSQRDAIGELMFECGVAVRMNYMSDGSSATSISYSSFSAYSVLPAFFGYNTYFEMRGNNDTQWKNLLRSELDAGRPVYYRGTNTNPAGGGHAFICDGYEMSEEKFYFNWGWGGSGDGLYKISALDVSRYAFNKDQGIIIIEKDPNHLPYQSKADGINTFEIATSESSGGYIIPESIVKYRGTNQPYIFEASYGYEIDQVLIDGVPNASAKANGYYTFSDITSHHSIDVTFKSITTGIEVVPSGDNCSIYPNPAKDEIFIKSELPIKKVEVYSLSGILMLSESDFSEKISISALSNGVYIMKIHTESGASNHKIIKL